MDSDSTYSHCDNWRQFYWRWLVVSVNAPWTWADSIASALGLAIPFAIHFYPRLEARLTPLAWEVPICGLAALSVARVLIAPYLIYRERHARAMNRETEMELETAKVKRDLEAALDDRIPKFKVEIAQLGLFRDADGSTLGLAICSVVNKGAASAALNWGITLFQDKKIYPSIVLAVNEETTFIFGGMSQELVINSVDMIYNKTFASIGRGDQVAGYLMFKIPNLPYSQAVNLGRPVVTFNDYLDTQHSGELNNRYKFDQPVDQLIYHPGAGGIIKQRPK